MLELVREAGLEGSIGVDSAGTESWHAGKGADPRSQAEANRRLGRAELRQWPSKTASTLELQDARCQAQRNKNESTRACELQL